MKTLVTLATLNTGYPAILILNPEGEGQYYNYVYSVYSKPSYQKGGLTRLLKQLGDKALVVSVEEFQKVVETRNGGTLEALKKEEPKASPVQERSEEQIEFDTIAYNNATLHRGILFARRNMGEDELYVPELSVLIQDEKSNMLRYAYEQAAKKGLRIETHLDDDPITHSIESASEVLLRTESLAKIWKYLV